MTGEVKADTIASMMYRDALARGAVGATLTLSLILVACASKPEPVPAPVDDGSRYLVLGIEGVTAQLLERDRAQLSGVFYIENGSPHEWLLASLGMDLASEGQPVPIGQLKITRSDRVPGLALTAASRERFAFVLECAVPPGDGTEWVLDLAARADLILEGETRVSRRAVFTVGLPRIQDPVFSIKKVRIKQAELVNTRLLLEVCIENPNAVGLVFEAMDYTFYGEGRWWAESHDFEETAIGPRETTLVELELVMNFIDMKRSLLDQVIKMARIGYRLEGSAGIEVAMEGFPPFVYPFAIEGQSPVVK